MHIRSIALDGFKSFARRTELPFYEDFTAISGPNGSGKSNIIDAVLFCLGLARTRGIRARKLTDLIYNPGHEDGTDADGPREATVEVTLDNTDGTFDRSQVTSAAGSQKVGDVDTITVRRRVKRTEENYYSYYYLNERSVNLSDIQDLLAQAGITPEGYNVVMQGDVTGIISMTPGERREIIEEIAGVSEFDAKKADAFEELDVVEERIDEADLRIEEKEGRLGKLEDERERALEYQSLREEKAEYEGYRKAAELEGKREERGTVREAIAELEDDLEERRRELDERQGRVSRLEDELDELNTEIERTGEDDQLELKREIESVKGEMSRINDAIGSTEDRVQEAEADRREAFVELDRKQETVEELSNSIRERKIEKASIVGDIEDLEGERDELETEIEAVDTEYAELKEALAERRDALEAAKDERNELQREQDRLLDQARRRSKESEELETEIEAARESIPGIESKIGELEREREKAERNVESIEGVVADLKDQKEGLGEDVDEIEDDLRETQREYSTLESKSSGDASYGRAVSTVLNSDLDGVRGTIAQLGSVDPEYASACETAAGGRLAHVVVSDDGVGERAIEYLKSRNAGRATFLPLTEMENRSLPGTPSESGVVGFAYDLVEFPEEYAGAFSYVLGDTLVVESMSTARDLMGRFRLVTLEGELVEKSGAMTGGSSGGSRYSFSGSGRLERVADRITELEDERSEIRNELRAVEGRLDDARDRRSAARDEVREIDADIEREQERREEREGRVEELRGELADLETEREEVDERTNELGEELTTTDEHIREIETEIESYETEIADSAIPELTNEVEELETEIGELEDRRDELDGESNELGLEKQYAENAIEDLEERIENAQNRTVEGEERIEELEEEIDDQEDRLAEKEAAVEELEDELAELKAEREDHREVLSRAIEARDEHRERVEAVESDLEEREATAERLASEISALEEAVGEYDPEEIPEHEELETEIERLASEMADLEPVNMLAIEEYDEVEDELEDLTEKRATLAEERDGITERISSYETRKKETFMEAYEAIDEQFERIFARLSSGTGTLHLENEADPFEGGLTMRAQPAGKPIQRLDAMSGGEKSLTALAFIFAIQRYNPAPFYALDEVDAFLDAANAERVGELVDELAGDAQFVVVTHRSAMLERAERAIGVTMQEENVSTVTGIELGGQEAPADD